MLSQAQHCAPLIISSNLQFEEAARLLSQTGFYLHQRARYTESEFLNQHALAIREQTLGSTHPHFATSLNNLAELYRSQGKYALAEPLYQRALSIFEQTLGGTHPDSAAILNNLALLYHNQRKYAEAEPLYKRALAIRKQPWELRILM